MIEVSRLTVSLYANGQAGLMKDEKLSDLMDSFQASHPTTIVADDSIAVPPDGAAVTARFVVAMLSNGTLKTGVYGDADALMARWRMLNRKEAVPC